MKKNLFKKLAKIKLLAMDFDGVMTDGYVYVDQDGRESVKCSRKDGLGIEMLKNNGIEVAVISKEKNPVIAARCKKLNIPCWQEIKDSDNKLQILQRIMKDKNLTQEEVAYIGDDLNDMNVLKYVGVAITVADGHPIIKKICHCAIQAKGGSHAVREICEKILESKRLELKF